MTMKPSTILLIALASCASGSALAQSCAAPIFFGNNMSISGDTCTAANELGTLCIFGQSPANDIIYSLTFAAGNTHTTVSLTNNTPAWNAALVLVQGACNGNSICPRNADAGGAGASESLDVAAVALGTYFLVVTSSTGDLSCGAYNLSIDGTPVELQSFDVI